MLREVVLDLAHTAILRANVVHNITDSVDIVFHDQTGKADCIGKKYLRSDIIASQRHRDTISILAFLQLQILDSPIFPTMMLRMLR